MPRDLESAAAACHNSRVPKSTKTSKAERTAARAALRALPQRDRAEVFTLAKQRLVHPNPVVAAAASEWAHANEYKVRRRMPPFVLPMVGVAEGIGGYLVEPDVLSRLVVAAAGVFVVCCGLQGWYFRHLVKLVLAVSAPVAPKPRLTVELYPDAG